LAQEVAKLNGSGVRLSSFSMNEIIDVGREKERGRDGCLALS